jgi:light-regulated signal transduction histidine kinase (bacteriophytochrome)
MIDDLLTYARVSTNVKPATVVDMNEVLALVKVDLELGLRESNGSIINERLPFIIADKSQMMLLLENLVGNAIKYHGKETPEIKVGFRDSSNEWLFWVRDNGIGIDPKYHLRIFQIFQRLHTQEEYKGTGMGLAISKRIVEQHGGRIWLESEEGKGATFFFTIPKESKME